MKYLLDTNICIALIRQKSEAILQKLTTLAPGDVGISCITLAELFYGSAKSTHPEQNNSALEQFLLSLELVDFDQQAASAYGKIRAELEKNGKIIGSMDMLIAAQAISLGTILVTNNTREFKRVSGLLLEDWIAETG
jgi:tRNA(fMet)-specific endonuclease VapC